MIINGLKLPIEHSETDLLKSIANKCGYTDFDFRILKKSIDARFNNVMFVYNVEVSDKGKTLPDIERLCVPKISLDYRPVVVGSGPCGLFAAYILAKAGLNPILVERGKSVDERIEDVNSFWNDRNFDTVSNVQFGEGGAGTFSDGKLTTQINNPYCMEVLQTFVECGASNEILYVSKPHLGTDNLVKIVKNIRNKIIDLGGSVLFEHQLTDIITKNNRVVKVVSGETIETEDLILAIGHSARDTFKLLYDKGVKMAPKPFSVGVRIEHLQSDINSCQYGKHADNSNLPAADYKLSYHTKDGRGVYTFCMCPGGVVVASCSENESIVTNGMSYSARDGINANSAFLVSVTPDDFGTDPFDGVRFQQNFEKKAFELAGKNYNAPCQLFGDFLNDKISTTFGNVKPTYKPGVTFCNFRQLFPDYIINSMVEASGEFAKKIKCFNQNDAVLTGPETRSSSPVRILRDESLQCNIKGIYPAGEGAGYAGGIMSAAVDGIKCAMALINNRR